MVKEMYAEEENLSIKWLEEKVKKLEERVSMMEEVTSDLLIDWGKEEVKRILKQHGNSMWRIALARVVSKLYGWGTVYYKSIQKAISEMVKEGEVIETKKLHGERMFPHYTLKEKEG